MIAFFKKTLFTLLLCIHSLLVLSQSQEIRIEFIGNCGFHMSDGVSNIYVDFPYKSGAYGYMEYDRSALDSIQENPIFLFTHKHADHFSRKNLKQVMKSKGGVKYGVANISKLAELSESIADFDIEWFKTKHSFFGIPFRHYSFLITWHGKKIYISGDTTNPETIGSVKDIELAFVPYWILQNARNEGVTIDAKMFAVYHLYPQQIASAKENWDSKDDIRPMIEQGEVISIPLE